MSDNIDRLADCETCYQPIEHYAGIPGNEWQTPYWRHLCPSATPHAAVPDEATIREVEQ